MTASKFRWRAAAILAICLAPLAGAQDFTILVNQSMKVDSISRIELRDVFTGESTSIHGVKVTPILLAGGLAHEALLRFLGTNAPAFAEMWRRQVFTGKGSMPRSVESEEAVIRFVGARHEAIGYVCWSKPAEGIKVLKVR